MSTNLIVLLAAGAAAALLGGTLGFHRLVSAGYPRSRALAVEAVAAIGCIGAVQSYTALRGLALLGDLPDWLATVAPATVDLFAPVMGLAALEARRDGRDRYAERLALGYSVAAVLANLSAAALDASSHPEYTAARVALVAAWHTAPVVTFLFGSHWLIRRHAIVGQADGLAELRAELAAISAERDRAGSGREAAERSLSALRAELERAQAGAGPARGRRAGPRSAQPSRRAPAGARREEMRALLEAPGGRELTGDELGTRLGIDAGYARRLRAEVLGAEAASPLALVNAGVGAQP